MTLVLFGMYFLAFVISIVTFEKSHGYMKNKRNRREIDENGPKYTVVLDICRRVSHHLFVLLKRSIDVFLKRILKYDFQLYHNQAKPDQQAGIHFSSTS